MIGTKTITSTVLFAGAASAAWRLGILRPERLAAVGPGALFFAGCFGLVVGVAMYRFWNLGSRSVYYFRYASGALWEDETDFVGSARRRIAWGENKTGDAFDLGPRLQGALAISVGLLVGLATIDPRALALLARFPERIRAASSSYCPDPSEAAAVAVDDPNAPGCALIRRAYELGYADSLGDCGAHTQGPTAKACNLRQRDEPFLHYAWRLFQGTTGGFQERVNADYFTRLKYGFDQRTDHLGLLYGAQRQILVSAPHASHHIWTNLPDPGDDALHPEKCAELNQHLPHLPPEADATHRESRTFEHILGQLLFESSYEPSAGNCREYRIHWGAPADACQKLAAAPEQFLTEQKAIGHVRQALQRYNRGLELDDLWTRAEGSTRLRPHANQRVEPSTFISFQCYVEGGATAGRTAIPFKLDGIAFAAVEERVPSAAVAGGLYVDRYKAVASMLAQGFHYGALLSEAGLEASTGAEELDQAFRGRDFFLSRLHGLAGLDIFLDPGWIAKRPDLLEVYPYHVHLRNFVQVFRRQYGQERGRM